MDFYSVYCIFIRFPSQAWLRGQLGVSCLTFGLRGYLVRGYLNNDDLITTMVIYSTNPNFYRDLSALCAHYEVLCIQVGVLAAQVLIFSPPR